MTTDLLQLPDSSAVDEAIIQVLATDAGLAGLIPAGVFWDVAPANVTTFVAVSLVESEDRWLFGAADGQGVEVLTYEVKVVTRDTSGEGPLRQAAARIHEVLHGGGLPVIDGFECLAVLRQGRIRRTVVDITNDTRWMQRGGRYQVTVQPLPEPISPATTDRSQSCEDTEATDRS